MGLSHSGVRTLIRDAFHRTFSREPTRSEAQMVHAVAELETSCGDGWAKPEDDAANNFGAIQAGASWTGATFEHRDSSPQPDGTNKWYVTKFRKYPTPAAGILDLVGVVYVNRNRAASVLPAATDGDSLRVSRALHSTGYYEGYGRTVEERIGHHHLALKSALQRIARDLGEPMPGGEAPPDVTPRVLRIRSQGPDVAWMQRALGIVPADGIFGPKTREAVIAWQRSRRIKPDGFFGPVSRLVLTGEELEAADTAPDTERDPSVRS